MTGHKIYTAVSCAKGILIGEHAVMYGHPAISFAIPDITLRVSLQKREGKTGPTFETRIDDQLIKTPPKMLQLIEKSFRKCFSYFEQDRINFEIENCHFVMDSEIPLGGGMGGSAAMSVAFVRLCQKICETKKSDHELIQIANEIDSAFHGGKASGIDVHTIFSDGIIIYDKTSGTKKLTVGAPFWIALTDTKKRTPTADMIAIVQEKIKHNPKDTEKILSSLGNLCHQSAQFIAQGKLVQLGVCLHEAQEHLKNLGVSCTEIENTIKEMNDFGSLGSKLTGGGGGGLVLSLFASDPTQKLKKAEHTVFCVTQVS